MADRSPSRTGTLLAGAISLVFVAAALWFCDPGRLVRLARVRLAGEPPPAATVADRTPAQPDEPPAGRFVEVARVEADVEAASGGALEFSSGAGRLRIPPAALRRDTRISAVELRAEDSGELAIDLQPDGLTFDQPARLELAAPAGRAAGEVEIVCYDRERALWAPEADQEPAADPDRVLARITHLSLRRVRIRPGMNFPFDPARARASFFLESDPGNLYEKLVDGQWQVVGRKTPGYRELVKMGRLGRSDLIASGRLRAVAAGVAGPEPLNDTLREVILPRGAPPARTGWVKVIRLDDGGAQTKFTTVARVIPTDDAATGAGSPVRLSRAVMEALGLTWGADFGVTGEDPERTIIKATARPGGAPAPFVSVMLEACSPAPPPA